MRQEHQVGSFNNCISELQQQACAQRLEVQDAQHGFSKRACSTARRISYDKLFSEILRSEACAKCKMKRAQEQRVHEVSAQELRERHDTIQRVTTRSSSRNSPLRTKRERRSVPQATGSGTFSQEMTKNGDKANANICRKAVDFEFVNTCGYSAEFYGWTAKTANIKAAIRFPNPQLFWVWEIRFKNQVTTCSDFPSDAMLWIKEVEMVDSVDEFPEFSKCWTPRSLLL